jgi:nickel superoxide dismutase
VRAIQKKYQSNDDPVFRQRCINKGAAQRASQAPPVAAVDRLLQAVALREVPQLHEVFNKATKAAGGSGVEASADPKNGEELLDYLYRPDRHDPLGDQESRIASSTCEV